MALLTSASAALATESQIGARGFSPERVYSSEDVDSVNLFNGNLTLAIPIGPRYPLNQSRSYGLTLDRDAQGNLVRERYYGGHQDGILQEIPMGVSVCDLVADDAQSLVPQYELEHTYSHGVLATSRYVDEAGAEVLSLADRDIDAKSGLVSASRDASGVETTFLYDKLGRLRWATPAPGTGARTQVIHSEASGATPANVWLKVRPNPGAGLLAESRTHFDGFGRVEREERLQPSGGGWTERLTSYTDRGWKASVTEWGSASKTEFLDHDPFGRPRKIRPPDGAAHEIGLAYLGNQRVDRTVSIGTSAGSESPATTSELYDGWGRLVRVIEPALGVEEPLETRYRYDHMGNLLEVDPEGFAAMARQYDRFGNLTTEEVRELGNPDFFYFDHDAVGNPGYARVYTSGGTVRTGVRLDYDRAGRVTEVREAVDAARVLKEFEYATANQGGDLRKGKLWRATRHNYLGDAGVDVEIEEEYAYEGIGGRVSSRTTRRDSTPLFEQEFDWTETGQIARLGYPVCAPGVSCTGATGRDVLYAYDQERLYSVGPPSGTPYVTDILYRPSGLAWRVRHGTTLRDVWGEDPHGMARPQKIQIYGVSPTFASGDYSYDGAGNITAMGSEVFEYDEVSRLTLGTVAAGAESQTVVYDRLGSILEMTTAGVREPFKVSPTHSGLAEGCHLLAGKSGPESRRETEFDRAGNLTRWGARPTCLNGGGWDWTQEYEWDAVNMMVEHRDHPGAPGTTPERTTRFVYTADDERIGREEVDLGRTTWTVRDLDGKVLRTLEEDVATGAFTWLKDYVWQTGKLVASEDPANGRLHYHLDHLGTPRLVTNSAGGFVPQRWNRYVYASNNPLRFIDPTGRSSCLVSTVPRRRTPSSKSFRRRSKRPEPKRLRLSSWWKKSTGSFRLRRVAPICRDTRTRLLRRSERRSPAMRRFKLF